MCPFINHDNNLFFKSFLLDNKHNFIKYTTTTINSLNTTYDYESIMHYKFNAFAYDRSKPTIKTRDPSKQYSIGRRKSLSDIDKVNEYFLARQDNLFTSNNLMIYAYVLFTSNSKGILKNLSAIEKVRDKESLP